jgi:Ca2+-transporting ATPase
MYVGFATVGIFSYWYIYFDHIDGHSLISWARLTDWNHCDSWKDFTVNSFDGIDLSVNPCLYFSAGKKKPVTLALTVLVVIEMLNALNAISDESSLLTVTIFENLYLALAIIGSISIHCLILYVPFFNDIFGILPLDLNEWILVMAFSVPVVFIEEIIKVFVRNFMSNNKDHAITHEEKTKTN